MVSPTKQSSDLGKTEIPSAASAASEAGASSPTGTDVSGADAPCPQALNRQRAATSVNTANLFISAPFRAVHWMILRCVKSQSSALHLCVLNFTLNLTKAQHRITFAHFVFLCTQKSPFIHLFCN
jgi:hypothetical protein